MSEFLSWGRYPKVNQRGCYVSWKGEDLSKIVREESSLLPYGQGRSYGDSCLNSSGVVVSTKFLNRLISFNSNSGVLRCESGVTLEDILHFSVPRGWFLPVTPGTQFVSVGGAIANDVHGKNHHCAGTFGCFVTCFELVRSNGERVICSNGENHELYQATIGGLGLTGFISWAEIQLKKVENGFIDLETIKFENLDEFFEVSRDSTSQFDYTVAWLDCLSKGEAFGRGHFIRGNHSTKPRSSLPGSKSKGFLTVPFNFPGFVLNSLTMTTFNTVYYNRLRNKKTVATSHYFPFFYPLDAVSNWNRIYSSGGFLQFQCVVPQESDNQAIRSLLKLIVASGSASFLAVLKEFGDIKSPGMLSFPKPGVTLCLDFPFKGQSTLNLFGELEKLVLEAGGRMYPAKDACMTPAAFKTFYPNWDKFCQFKDPNFNSDFWNRMTQGE